MIGARLATVVVLVLSAACAPPRPAAHVLRVGTSGDYTPFSIRTGTELHGFDVEAAKRFAQDTGRQLEFVAFRWPSLEADLGANRFDVAMSGVTIVPSRALVGTFTRPLVRVGAMVLARQGIAATARDLDRPARRIGVNAGGYLERLARRLFPRAAIVPIGDNRQLVTSLAAAATDAIVSDEIEAPLFQRAVPTAVLIGPLTSDRKAFLARDPALATELDTWIRAREGDGFLAGLRAWALGARWGTRHSVLSSDLDALLALIDLRLGFMPAVARAKEAQGIRTEDPAREEAVRARARERAVQLGAAPDAIDRLMVALINASRRVQDAFRRTPAAERPPVDVMDLDRDVRPVLDRLSTTIVDRASDLAEWPENAPKPTAAAIAEALDPSLAPLEARLDLANAVVGLLGAR